MFDATVRETNPVTAPKGTLTLRDVDVAAEGTAVTVALLAAENVTTLEAGVVLKPDPLKVIVAPGVRPTAGLTFEMYNGTVVEPIASPYGWPGSPASFRLTKTGPLTALLGTATVSVFSVPVPVTALAVAEANVPSDLEKKTTSSAAVKENPVPVTESESPGFTGPAGFSPIITGVARFGTMPPAKSATTSASPMFKAPFRFTSATPADIGG